MVSPGPIVAFRVDAAPHMGSGHLMRCLTLADQLRLRGARTHLLARPLSSALATLIESRGHALHPLPAADGLPSEDGAPAHAAWLGTSQAADAAACEPLLRRLQPDWMVVDHYALDARWEQHARGAVGRILAIDDLADRAHDCDMLLDANYHADAAARYDRRVPAYSRRLTGPRYALLRPEFAAARARRRIRDDHVQRVLVSLGGVDAQNLSARALQATLRAVPSCGVDVVVGADSPHRTELEALCAAEPRAMLHVQTARMAELIESADLAVGAAGSSTWERMCLGLPTLLLAIAANQVPGLQSLCEAGLAFGHGDAADLDVDVDALQAMLQALALAPAFRHGLSRRGAELVDGQGTRRVADALLPLPLALRPAQAADCADLHAWRNHPAVRGQAHDPREIAYDAHCRWFERTLTDPARALLVGQDAAGPVGVVRFDLHGDEAVVSIYLVPQRLGSGLGAPLLRGAGEWMLQQHPHIRRIRAEILPGNPASTSVFLQAGYGLDHHVHVFRPGGPTS